MIEAPEEVRAALSPGEKLLWWGAPATGLRLGAQDVFLIPFSLVWGGFAVFWEWSVLSRGGPTFFALWGLPFVAMGVYIVAGRFFVDAWRRARTRYALTDERVLIITPKEMKSLRLQTLTELSLTERRGGVGNIAFGSTSAPPMSNWVGGSTWPRGGRYAAPSLDSIDDARTVYELIRNAQRKTSQQ
jgi:hypothetical protein